MTRASGMANFATGVSALVVPSSSAGLFSANGQQGGVLIFDAGQSLAVVNSYAFGTPDNTMRAGIGRLEAVRLGGKDMLISFGQSSIATGFDLAAADVLWKPTSLNFGGQTLLALKAMPLADGSDLIFTSSLQSLGISCWLRNPAGQISLAQQLVPNNTALGYEVLAMTLVLRGSGALLLAVSAQGDALNAFRIDATGQAQFVASLGAADGLGIAAPDLLQSVRLAGHDYALLAAAGSGSIAVIEVGAAGQLRLVDQVNDDLNTRFQGISVLQTLSVEGRVFVLAGGADDGLSLMALLPNGRLMHLATVADTRDTALANVSAAALVASGSGAGLGLDIFATGWSETTISQFRVDLGALAPIQSAQVGGSVLLGDARGDLLLGGQGGDQLYGGAGDDILIDGAGSDRLSGGAGADVFLFTADGCSDTVLDFDITKDRLDLSGLGRIYAREAVSFSAMAGGILLTVLGEQIRLFSANGSAISAQALSDAVLFDLGHVPVYAPVTTGQTIAGTALADTLLGAGYGDTLTGGAGHDQLAAGAGSDVLDGGPGNDVLDGGLGNDRAVFNGLGAVVVNLSLTGVQNTGQGWDTLQSIELVTSGGGNDLLIGSTLPNSLIAGAGNDSLYGSAGNDTLEGGTGDDLIDGGAGIDTAWFRGETAVVVDLRIIAAQNTGQGRDTLRGIENLSSGDGNDRLTGNALANHLGSGAGNDTLSGGIGDDTLEGGAGNDRALYLGLAAVVVNLATLTAQNTGQGRDVLRNIEHISSGRGDDLLIGNGAGNSLMAGLGNDTLRGGLGNDTLVGNAGNDVLDAGAGHDVVYGGLGADVFVFHPAPAHTTPAQAYTRIVDLDSHDHIELLGFGYASTSAALSHFSQTAAGVVFSDHGDTVLFSGTHLSDFSASMIWV